MKKIIALIVCLCVVIFISIWYVSRDKEYEDVKVDLPLNSIADCVTAAEDILISDKETVNLSGIGIRYADIHDKNPTEVLITFVQINKYIFWAPYTVYTVTINPNTYEAYNISKKHCEYVIYDDIQIQNWNLDFNNATNNDSIKRIMEEYDIRDERNRLIH